MVNFLFSLAKNNLVESFYEKVINIFFIDRKCKWFNGNSKSNENKNIQKFLY